MMRQNSSGRYIVHIPFIKCMHELGKLRAMAEKKIPRTKAREFVEIVFPIHAIYDGIEDLGSYVQSRCELSPGSNFYLLHHSVIKATNTTIKLCVVFDRSPGSLILSLNPKGSFVDSNLFSNVSGPLKRGH